jgi:hypothetical protein
MKSILLALHRDERSLAVVECAIIFAFLAGLIFATNAVLPWNSRDAVYTAAVIPPRKPVANVYQDPDTTFEDHFTIDELAKKWKYSRETVRLAAKDDPGVLKWRQGPKKARTRYSVPATAARRIHTRLLNGG